MKRTLSLLILLTFGLAWASAQDATTLQVAPSDQVKYPDASEVLNKTEPKASVPAPTVLPAPSKATESAGLPTGKPLVASPPVPAKVPTASVSDPEHGWFLKWTLTGDETSALGWVQALGLPASLHPLAENHWEVWAGPLEPDALKDAIKGQGGVATLVRR